MATPAASVEFLADITAANRRGEQQLQQQIHAATLELVRDARDFLVLDYFLFNGQGGPAGPLRLENGLSAISTELIDAVRATRIARPSLPVLIITDPINDYYRGSPPPELAALQSIGVDVVVTRLDRLRDSNPVYSATWRLLLGWWLRDDGEGRWNNPLDGAGPPLRLGALTRLPNFKANHRKLVLTGDGAGSLRGIVSSGNPHDASSAHSNVALRVTGESLRPLLASEIAIARWSGWQGDAFDAFITSPPLVDREPPDAVLVAVATEGAIREQLLDRFDAAVAGDAIDVAQFYLADRLVIRALLAADRRGVAVRILLDSNKDAFGFEKSGIPNRQVAAELLDASDGAIQLRWIRTHGEQFHVKLALVRSADRAWLTLGSANFTRRNLGDYNLEANLMLDMPAGSGPAVQVDEWFGMLWNNRDPDLEYSIDGSTHAEAARGRYWLYRLMEGAGFSTF